MNVSPVNILSLFFFSFFFFLFWEVEVQPRVVKVEDVVVVDVEPIGAGWDTEFY